MHYYSWSDTPFGRHHLQDVSVFCQLEGLRGKLSPVKVREAKQTRNAAQVVVSVKLATKIEQCAAVIHSKQ
jgi:hypothetical protein